MASDDTGADARSTRRQALSEFAEDATGFGAAEWRLTRDLIVKPRAVLDAYDAYGSSAGGHYPKPVRYYLLINGLYLLAVTLFGGFERTFDLNPQSAEVLPEMAQYAGKSVGEFRADLDQWFSLISVPIWTLFIAGAAYLLIRRWSPADDRSDFRQTFSLLNAYTLLTIPPALVALVVPSLMWWELPLTFLLLGVAFARMGSSRWWRTRRGGWLKGAVLLLAVALAYVPSILIIGGVAFAGAFFLP